MLKYIAAIAIAVAYVYNLYTGHYEGESDKNVMPSTEMSLSLNDVTVVVTKETTVSLTLKRSNEEMATVDLGFGVGRDGFLTKSKKKLASIYRDKDYRVKITLSELHDTSVCADIVTEAKRPHLPIQNCIDIKGFNWYGGAEVFSQRWPIQLESWKITPYLSFDIFQKRDNYGSVLERYFLTSDGMALFIDHDSPLHVGYDNQNLCLRSDYDLNYPSYINKSLRLNYTMCIAANILEAHKALLGKLWQFPVEVPDNEVLKSPIWSTWARFKMGVTQQDVKTYTEEIVSNNFPASHIEIDDMYTVNYGDWEWDTAKFPDPNALSGFIHDRGFRVTTWVMPFVNPGSKMFSEGMENGYFVKDCTGKVPGLVRWWQGTGALIDFTNQAAVRWFNQRLETLRKSGVDSFKFDAGENQYLPPLFKTHQPLQNPLEFVNHYVEALRQISDNSIEVRVGYQTQHVGILVRMMDKSSVWGYDNGLKTLIPSALHLGLIGYPFILPDMIGGNAYSENNDFYGNIPERELFIRWLEVTAFLPSMQFSIAPWQYDDETTQIALKFVKLHQEFVTPMIVKLAKEATQNGFPIIRPMWWVAPDDGMTFDLDSQFMIGDDLVIAPILDKGVTTRDIYLPNGSWQDLRSKDVVQGPIKLKNYSIQLDEIGLFQRV